MLRRLYLNKFLVPVFMVLNIGGKFVLLTLGL